MRRPDPLCFAKNNVLWEGKPSLIPFIFCNTKYIFISAVWCVFIGYYLFLLDPTKFSVRGLIISFIVLSPGLSLPFYLGYRYLLYKQIYYTISNKCIQIHIGHKSESLKYSDIGSFTVHTIVFRPSKNIGTISIHKGKGKDSLDRKKLTLIAVENAYDVFKDIKELTTGKVSINSEHIVSKIKNINSQFYDALKVFQKILSKDEEIVWLEKPHLVPFVLQDGLRLLLMIIGPVVVILYLLNELSIIYDVEPEAVSAVMPLMIILSGFLFRALYLITYRCFERTHVDYVCTNKSMIIKRGLILPDFTVLNYKYIHELSIAASITEKLFNSGTIKIYTGKYKKFIGRSFQILYEDLYDELVAIKKPFEAVSSINKFARQFKK